MISLEDALQRIDALQISADRGALMSEDQRRAFDLGVSSTLAAVKHALQSLASRPMYVVP